MARAEIYSAILGTRFRRVPAFVRPALAESRTSTSEFLEIAMRMQWKQVAVFVLAAVFAASASAQTSVGLSLYGAFNGATTGNNTNQSPSNSAGGLIELRHISNPIVGFEATYSYNRANQTYSLSEHPITCPVNGCLLPASVKANAHELTLDWIPSVPIGNLRPFGVLGLGLLLNQPTGSQSSTSSSTQPV